MSPTIDTAQLLEELNIVVANASKFLQENVSLDTDRPLFYDFAGKETKQTNYHAYIFYESNLRNVLTSCQEAMSIYSDKYEKHFHLHIFTDLISNIPKLRKLYEYAQRLSSLQKKDPSNKFLVRQELSRALNSQIAEYKRIIIELFEEHNLPFAYKYFNQEELFSKMSKNTSFKADTAKDIPAHKLVNSVFSKSNIEENYFDKLSYNYPLKLRKPTFKVLFLSPGYDDLLFVSGVSKVVHDLVKAFNKHINVEVHTLLCWFNPTYYFILKNGKLHKFKSINEVLLALSEFEYDVIHFHTFTLYNFKDFKDLDKIISHFDFDDYKVPVVYTVHSNEAIEKQSYLKVDPTMDFSFKNFTIEAQKSLLKLSDKVISLTKLGKQQLIESYGSDFETSKIEIIYNISEPEEHLSRRPSNDTFKIGYLGRLSEEKGVLEMADMFVQAMPLFEKNVELHIIGGGTEGIISSMKNKLLPYISKVVFYGTLSGKDKTKVLSQIHLLLVPSRVETFGLVVSEAMYYKIPVVATPIPIFKELFKDNIFYLPAESRDQAKSLASLVNNYESQVSSRYLEKNKEIVQQNFSAEKIAKNHLELYQRITRRRQFSQMKNFLSIDRKIERDVKNILKDYFAKQGNKFEIRKLKLMLKKKNKFDLFYCLLSSGEDLIIKKMYKTHKQSLFYSYDYRKDFFLLKHLGEINPNLKIPKVYYFFEKNNFSYYVAQFSKGFPLTEFSKELHKEDYKSIYYQLGQEVKKLHSDKKNRFGNIRSNIKDLNETYSTWEDFFQTTYKVRLEKSKETLGPDTYSKLNNLLEEKRELLRTVKTASLVHNDLWYENFLINKNPQNPNIFELEAIIDFEKAFLGDPLYDLIQVKEWMVDIYGSDELWTNLMQGYGLDKRVIEPFEKIYLINIYLDAICLRVNKKENIKKIKELMK